MIDVMGKTILPGLIDAQSDRSREMRRSPLTTDGELHYAYGGRMEGKTSFISDRVRGIRKTPDGRARPVLYTYRLPLPGDTELPLAELVIFDIDGKRTIPVRYEKQRVTFETPIEV